MILIDTDVCIEILRGNRQIMNRRREYGGNVAVSFMTAGELFYGAGKSGHSAVNRHLVTEFLLVTEIIESDIDIMRRFGIIKAELKTRNEMLPDADIIIGATALEKCEKLITGNTGHFNRIPGLKVENWIR
ncbi:MAG: type II toxin-antitoxin system VapC family toxin [Spirochaetales bacterium]|nr:type II toxin-antitoxin system VapC family toxin [Spirochaetales bacterium]